MPTSAVAYLTRTLCACAGTVISASHNPCADNSIWKTTTIASKARSDISG